MRKGFVFILLSFLPFCMAAQINQKEEKRHTEQVNSSLDLMINDIKKHPHAKLDKAKRTDINNQLKQIQFFELKKYRSSINQLFNYLDTTLKTPDTLFLEILRLQSLNLYRQKKNTKAIQSFERYFTLYEDLLKTDTGYAFEYSKYTYIFFRLRDFDSFIKHTNIGLSKAKKKKNAELDLCYFHTQLCKYYNLMVYDDTARIHSDTAIDLYVKSTKKDSKLLSDIYRTKSRTELLSKNFQLAILYFNQSIESLLKGNYTEVELASLYKSKALAYLFDNQFSLAIKNFDLVCEIYKKEKPNSSSLSVIYYYLALSQYFKEDYESAANSIELSLAIEPEITNYFSHRQKANIYAAMDSLDIANRIFLEIEDYLQLSPEDNSYQITYTKYEYGRFLLEDRKKLEEGTIYLKECIDGYYKHHKRLDIDHVQPLNIIGTHYINTGQVKRGLDSLQVALKCVAPQYDHTNLYSNPNYSEIKNTSSFNNTLAWKAYGLYLLYEETKDIKDLKESLKTYDFYIFCSSENRKRYDKASSVLSSKQIYHVYNQAINVATLLYKKLDDRSYLEDVFKFIEGKKSFTLFQSLKLLESKKLLDIAEEDIIKEEKLKKELSILTEFIRAENNGSKRANKISNYQQKTQIIKNSLDSIQEYFKVKNPGYYQLKYGFKELSISEIKEQLTDNKAFLNYSLSDSLLHTLVFTPDTIVFNSIAIEEQFYKNTKTMTLLLKDINTDNSYNEFQDFSQSSHYLYQKLIQPYKEILKNYDLVLIPDNELNYISFDALVCNDTIPDRPDYRKLNYLIKDYKTNVANSMQIYFNIKSRIRNPNNTVIAFAPYYPLYPNKKEVPEEYRGLRPLDYNETEVKGISNIFKTNSYIGKEASKENFIKYAEDAGILHLAMHTRLNDSAPMRSKLLFTYNQDLKSGAMNTYELSMHPLNAELAVLSGCSTGDGKLLKGEGVMSLSSGFQFAGVPAIVMSLWEVNDRFGALVINKFYQYLADGLDKKSALYQAKIEVLAQGNALYAHPFYWAGLTLMGDDAKIKFVEQKKWDYQIFIFSILGLSLLLLIQWRRKWLQKHK